MIVFINRRCDTDMINKLYLETKNVSFKCYMLNMNIVQLHVFQQAS